MGRHVIAKQVLGRPSDYAEIFDILGREGILPKEYPDIAILVHLYHDVTTAELHEILSTRLPDIEQFCQHILRYMNESM